ncbi:sporulation protein [Couchioplanes caeruleus]|uniref:sporulation protein n=1 Tax=Couchioplanes caeruleus TaxID=56438 RepID=UPI0020C11D89|nr:sporulation protein [Couchioplanes caeruleus]UQU66332.1 sporulation protein [Couchioplanes caeruleus]
MVFEKVLRAFGVGGPSVDTVLATPGAYPGSPLMGAVRLTGGDYDVAVDTVAVGLVTRVEAEDGDALIEFHRAWVAAGFTLAAGEHQDIPFTITLPWETPITHAYGDRLSGMSLGLRTELTTEELADTGDVDVLAVHALPAQEKVLTALNRLGFHLRHADVERGAIYGVRHELPFFQEIEHTAPPEWPVNELELTFIADSEGIEVILELERHAGLLTRARDAYGRLRVPHDAADEGEWAAQLNAALRGALAELG